MDRGFDKAKKGADDFKQESGSTLRETAASISSLEDGLGAVQEVAANAFAGFGPVGAGAGLVAALGFGLLLENLNKQNEATELLKQRFADAYQTAAEEGRAYLDVQQILAEANDLSFNPERVEEYNQAVKDAKTLGLEANDVVLARSGDEEALQKVLDRTNDLRKEVDADFIRSRSTEAAELLQVQGRYDTLGKVYGDNATKAQTAQERKNKLHEREREEAAKTKKALQDMVAGPLEQKVNIVVNTSQLDAAKRSAELWAKNGLNVAVTGTLTGRTWE
jgi:predicted transcriptional regulator